MWGTRRPGPRIVLNANVQMASEYQSCHSFCVSAKPVCRGRLFAKPQTCSDQMSRVSHVEACSAAESSESTPAPAPGSSGRVWILTCHTVFDLLRNWHTELCWFAVTFCDSKNSPSFAMAWKASSTLCLVQRRKWHHTVKIHQVSYNDIIWYRTHETSWNMNPIRLNRPSRQLSHACFALVSK